MNKITQEIKESERPTILEIIERFFCCGFCAILLFFIIDLVLQPEGSLLNIIGIIVAGLLFVSAVWTEFEYRKEKKIADKINTPKLQQEYINETRKNPLRKGRFTNEYIEWLYKKHEKMEY